MKVFVGWWSILLSISLASAFNVVPSLHYLCNPSDDVYCTSQIFGDRIAKNESCVVKFHPINSSECSNLKFKSLSDQHFGLGNFHFKPYSWKYKDLYYNYTLFNLNFTDIKWSYMKFRFEAVNDTNQKVRKNHCREIVISGDTPDNFEIPFLNYDCQWSEQFERYENFSFILEYEAEHSGKYLYDKLIFNVPPTKSVDGPGALPFFYINLTDSSKLNLYATPQTSNDFTTVFLIEKCFEKNDSKAQCELGEITNIYKQEIYTYTPHCTGNHYFKITPIHETCPKSHCPYILTPKIYYKFPSVLYTILWNALWILLISGICFSLYWMIKRHQKFTPKILLLHPDADKVHMDILYKLSKYFEIEYGWMVVWNKEIELTQHGDPYIWCLEAFMNSNTVIYIDKPSDGISSNEGSGNIHMHLHDIFFKILKTNKRKKDMKFFNIMLDSHDPGAILPELKEFNTYYLPSEWQSFVRSIKRQSWVQKLTVKIPPLSNSTCGKELSKAFNQS